MWGISYLVPFMHNCGLGTVDVYISIGSTCHLYNLIIANEQTRHENNERSSSLFKKENTGVASYLSYSEG